MAQDGSEPADVLRMEPGTPDESRLELSEPALAEFLGEGTVSDAIARNELRAFLIDRRINVSRDEFERWVRQLADEGRQRAREAQENTPSTRWV